MAQVEELEEARGLPAPDRTFLTVTDLKQYAYCPRVVYYTYCLPLLRPQTAKMRESHLAHEEESRREVRRGLRPYGLDEGQREFDVPLRSDALGLSGKADLVITTAEEQIPVDYKLSTRGASAHFRIQLAAYGLMLREMRGLTVRRGFVYSLVTRKAEEVALTARLTNQVERLVAAIHTMIAREQMPERPNQRARCIGCEFRRFCNDL